MAGIFAILGGSGRKTPDKSTGLRVQTSVEGRPRPIGAGQNRYAGELIWYGDFVAIPQTSAQAQGGKGGIFSGKGNTQSYKYSASFMVSLGEQVTAIRSIQNSNIYDFFYIPSPDIVALLTAKGISVGTGNTYGVTLLPGDFTQTGWSYLNSAHPAQSLNYRGESVACFPNLGLGTNPTLPNFNFEMLWKINTDIATYGPDANAADWIASFLSDGDWGVGFPRALLAPLDLFAEANIYATGDLFSYFQNLRLWSRAAGLLISPVLTGQQAAQSHLATLTEALISSFVWADGLLDVVPLADASATGNGYTYNPAVTPIYDLDENDMMEVQHGPDVGAGPHQVKISRKDPTQVDNVIPLAYLDRGNLYNPKTIYSEDAAALQTRPRRPADLKQYDFFCNGAAANKSASLLLHRSKVLRTFYFKLPPQFALLKPGDIVTLTDTHQNLAKQPVRITEINRNADRTREFTAEEFLGNAHPPLYARQDPLGAGYNANEAPGTVATPIIFEPTAAEAGGLEIWMGVAGLDLTIWGGCNVWVATEAGGTYQKVGQLNGSSRMGVTTVDFPVVATALTPPTVDNTNTLSINLSISEGELISGSAPDMLALNTAMYVGGEIIAYQNATLTGANTYDLAPSVRGAYSSTIADHPIGTPVLRLDDGVLKIPYTADRVGSQIYIKLQSFNKYGGGLEDISTVGSIAYTIVGTALSTPLPDVTNLRRTFVDNNAGVNFDEVQDFRVPQYEIRIGQNWDTASSQGRVAHPPFPAFGDGNYLIKAVAEPAPGLTVYSTNAASILMSGTVLTDNVLASEDDSGLGWPGVVTGPGAISGGNFITTGTLNEITYYTSPIVYDALYSRKMRIDPTSLVVGVTDADFLADADIMDTTDILGGAPGAVGWVELLLSGDEAGDLFDAINLYDLPDLYSETAVDWVKYAPGYHLDRFARVRQALVVQAPNVIATSPTFSTKLDVETRFDHITNTALPPGGLDIVFRPDGYFRDVPFAAGPDGAPFPLVVPIILSPSLGDRIVVSNLTLTGCTVQALDSTSTGVARTANITIEGA